MSRGELWLNNSLNDIEREREALIYVGVCFYAYLLSVETVLAYTRGGANDCVGRTFGGFSVLGHSQTSKYILCLVRSSCVARNAMDHGTSCERPTAPVAKHSAKAAPYV